MFSIFNQEIADEYIEKIAFLKKNSIALWDVLESCERTGSADAAIRNPKPNDIRGLLFGYPAIQLVLFNGKSVEKLFKKHIGYNDLPEVMFRVLPSTSPAHAVRFEEKHDEWKRAIKECFVIGRTVGNDLKSDG